jgi:hypothetical protein
MPATDRDLAVRLPDQAFNGRKIEVCDESRRSPAKAIPSLPA